MIEKELCKTYCLTPSLGWCRRQDKGPQWVIFVHSTITTILSQKQKIAVKYNRGQHNENEFVTRTNNLNEVHPCKAQRLQCRHKYEGPQWGRTVLSTLMNDDVIWTKTFMRYKGAQDNNYDAVTGTKTLNEAHLYVAQRQLCLCKDEGTQWDTAVPSTIMYDDATRMMALRRRWALLRYKDA